MSAQNLKISIITACKNAYPDLQKTIKSIQSQSYNFIEHVIVDGDSTDGTAKYLNHMNLANTKWLSEKDKGISDAFNKGIQLASGDYLYFLGAGDTLYQKDILTKIFTTLRTRPLLICGKVMRTNAQGKSLWIAPQKWPTQFNKRSLLYKLSLPHQGLFTHKSYFERFGLFSLKCKFAMDYEIILRSYHNFPEIQLVSDIVATWQAGGIGHNRTLEIYDEYLRIKLQHQIASRWRLIVIDRWNRLKFTLKNLVG
ncbi:MAG TPA: glycosyltransferase family 2 protein [Gammaproteobacteria bacterium]|nr:glycosyltransferase family 2 protein [Gammaproteobacteria bacterium]